MESVIVLKDLWVALNDRVHLKHPQVISRYKRITFTMRHGSLQSSDLRATGNTGPRAGRRHGNGGNLLRRFATPTRWEQPIFRTFIRRHKCPRQNALNFCLCFLV